MAKHFQNLDAIFHALGDPTRRAIVDRLVAGPATVSELASPHDMALPSFMGHLKKLEEVGVIATYKKGRVRTCHLVPTALQPAQRWMRAKEDGGPSRLQGLDTFVSRMKGRA